MCNKLKLKVNNEALQLMYGAEIEIDVSKTGVPLKRYWRNRLRDAKIDNCVEVVEGKKPSAKVKTEKKGDD